MEARVRFNGDGYLQLNRAVWIHDNSQDTEVLEFDIKPDTNNGLIFWQVIRSENKSKKYF